MEVLLILLACFVVAVVVGVVVASARKQEALDAEESTLPVSESGPVVAPTPPPDPSPPGSVP